MATRKTDYTKYRGFAVLDRRLRLTSNIDAVNSNFTQASPEPDQPSPQQASYMQLEATGQLTAAFDGTALTVRSGAPVGGNAGGRYAWKEDADDADEYRGHLNYNIATGWSTVVSDPCREPFAVLRLPNQDLVIAYNRISITDIRVRVFDDATRTWSAKTTISTAAAATTCPALVRLPQGSTTNGGRILLFWVDDVAEGGVTYYRLSYAYSDDDAASWTIGGTSLDGFRETWSPESMSVCYDGKGTLHMVVESSGSGNGAHLISTSFGASWTEVETIAGARKGWRLYADRAGNVGAFYALGGSLYYARKDNPTTAFADSAIYDDARTENPDNQSTTGIPDIALTMDEEGFVIVATRDSTNPERVRVRRYNAEDGSINLDRWWHVSGDSTGELGPIDIGDSNNHLDAMALTPYRGRLVLFSQNVSSAATLDSYIHAYDLGGWSSVDWKGRTFGYSFQTVAKSSGYTYYPFERPQSISLWTRTTAGTASATLVDAGVTISTTAGTEYYSRNGSTTVDQDVHVWLQIDPPASGGSLASLVVGVVLYQRITGPNSYKTELRFDATGFRLYDAGGAATLGTDVTTMSTGTKYDVLFAIEGGVAKTYWKAVNTEVWNAGPTGSPTSTTAVSNHFFAWGHFNSGTADSTWGMVASSIDSVTDAVGIAGQTNPDDLQGRAYSVFPQFLKSGLQVRAKGSATVLGDSWGLATRYGYGLHRADLLVNPSPTHRWRTTGTSALNVDVYLNGGLLTKMARSSIVVAFLDTNVPSVVLSRVTGGTPTSLGTISATKYLSAMDWTRSGNLVTLTATGSTNSRYIEEGELVGATFTDGSNYSSISANSAGVIVSGTTLRVTLRLETVGSFGASGSGSGVVRSKHVIGVIHNLTDAYDALRFAVPSGTSAEGYWRVGGIFAGPLHILGRQYDRGWQETRGLNVRAYEDDRGTVYKQRRGPAKRAYSFTWSPFDSTAIHGADPDPNYLSANASSSSPFALENDPYALAAVYEAAEDGVLPLLYLPAIDGASSGSVEVISYNLRREFCYATITAALERSHPLGNELESEMVTTAFRIEELV